MNFEQGAVPNWTKYTAAGLIAVTALSSCTTPQHNSDPAPSKTIATHPTNPVNVLPPQPENCSAVTTPTDISIATHLMAQPGNIYLQTVPMDPSKREAGINSTVKVAAAKQGLTVFDERTLAGKLYERVDSKPRPSFQSIFALTHNYMAKLGVDLEIGRVGDPEYSYGSRRPTSAELNTAIAEYDLIDTMSAFSTVPKEYIALAGLKHIYLVAGTSKSAEGYTDAASSTNEAYYKDIKEADGPGIDLHEFSHMVDGVECGTAIFNDPNWVKLNQGIKIYGTSTNDTKHISYQDKYIYDSFKIFNREQKYLQAHDRLSYCKLEAAYAKEAEMTISYSNYHTTAAEDKAEIMKNIPDTYGWSGITSKRFPILYDKFRLELARLNHLSSRVAQYFADISNRTESFADPTAPKC